MKLKVKINPIALQDIKEIKEYIREENINAIKRFSEKITDAIETLSEFPEIGMELSKKILLKTDYRYLIVDEYMIFYKFSTENLFIYRILNGRRDYMKILFEYGR